LSPARRARRESAPTGVASQPRHVGLRHRGHCRRGGRPADRNSSLRRVWTSRHRIPRPAGSGDRWLPPVANADQGSGCHRGGAPDRPGVPGARVRPPVVIAVMMSRSWTVNVFQAFTPTWYEQLGYGPEFYGPLATTLVLAGAVGTVGCGSLADRFGRRSVILATLVLSVPAILLFALYPGPWAFASAILIGFL